MASIIEPQDEAPVGDAVVLHDAYGLPADASWPEGIDPDDWRNLPEPDDQDYDDDEDRPITPDVLALLGFDPDEDDDEEEEDLDTTEPLRTENAFCPTGPGGGIDPHCSPQDIAHTATAAHGRNDQQVLAQLKDFVFKAGQGRAKRGEFGAKGMGELAKALGIKGHSKLKKAGLSQAIQDHLTTLTKGAPGADLHDRLDRVALAEKHTGIKFEDRVVAGVIAGHPIGKSVRYKEAYADVAQRGPSASSQNVTYLKATRDRFKKEIANGDHDMLAVHTLAGVAASGYGNLSHQEFLEHLHGLTVTVTKPQGPAAIVPDVLGLLPAGKSKRGRKSVAAPQPDYIDRLKAPAADRLKQIKTIEEASKIPFAARVIHGLTEDHRVVLPGKATYLANAARQAQGEHLTAAEKRGLSGFRQAVAASIKFGDVPRERLVDALERVDNAGHGTMRVDEFEAFLKKRKVT